MDGTAKTVLRVEGMSCPSCIARIQRTLRDLDGVRRVDVRLREGKVAVEHQEQQPTVAEMTEALREAGYVSAPEAQA